MTSEQYIHISKGGVTFTTLLVSLLDSIFKQYDINIIGSFSNDSSIYIQIK